MRALLLLSLVAAVLPACKKEAERAEPVAAEPASSAVPAAATPTPAPTLEDAAERIAARLGELATAAQCARPDSSSRNWCVAAQGWATGTAAELPVGGSALLGLSLTLDARHAAAAAILEPAVVSVLALRNEGGTATAQTSTITPTNAAEGSALTQAAFNLALVFKGQVESAEVPAPLVEFIGSLPAVASNPAVAGGRGWRFDNPEPVELRRVGNDWVAVQLLPDDPEGLVLTTFTDRFVAL
ncbi:MAG: hypothetical protein JXB32_22145 [Deltaproteobacteria bacterium]|nr:hypothetical protein [Deltaproteobacteria bacterium]